MKPMRLIALAVMFALVFCGVVIAGPKQPSYGDPDIVDTSTPKRDARTYQMLESAESPLIIDFWIFKCVIRQHGVSRAEQQNAARPARADLRMLEQ